MRDFSVGIGQVFAIGALLMTCFTDSVRTRRAIPARETTFSRTDRGM
jgi:hypothetical protein